MKTTLFLVSWILTGGMLWGGTVTGASLQKAGTSTEQAREVITLKIEGWTCASCEKDIRRALLAVPGVKSADVSYARSGAIVEVVLGHARRDQLVQAVAGAGNILSAYRATVVPNGSLTDRTGERDGWFLNLFK
jgi:copper chaperone CopZ